jgi:hypothetical protein
MRTLLFALAALLFSPPLAADGFLRVKTRLEGLACRDCGSSDESADGMTSCRHGGIVLRFWERTVVEI